MTRVLVTCALALFATTCLASEVDPAGRITPAAERIKDAAFASTTGYDTLAELCDNFGHRLSGSDTLEASIDWAAEKMREFGFVNVRKEPATVPHWVRNQESATILEPARHELAMLGLGTSVGTGPDGVTAEVVRAASFDEFDELADEDIAGRIVLFDAPYEDYGKTVQYRVQGASRAAARGAVAVLVRSVGVDGMRTPHTGGLRYAEDVPRIPAAALSFEDANLIARMIARGDEVKVHLFMGAETRPDAISHNVIGEIPGTDLADEIVVVGGHIDSWDVGQGAQDDGVGCVLSMEAVRLIHDLDLRPRRTLRVVLFTNEENGLGGGTAYARDHADELDRHFAAMESDSGNGLADGFRLDLRRSSLGAESTDEEYEASRNRAKALLEQVTPLLESLGSEKIHLSYGGADIGPITELGVPGLGVNHASAEYFRIHHTHADTFDRIDLRDMQTNTASMAIMLFALAEMDASLRP